MLFNFFDDVLLLYLPLKTSQRVLQRLSVLKSNFSQSINTLFLIRNNENKNHGEQVAGLLPTSLL